MGGKGALCTALAPADSAMEQFASGCDVDDDVWVYTNEERSSWLTGRITNISPNIIDVQIKRGGQPHEEMQVPWDRIIRHQKRSTKGIPDAEEATPDECWTFLGVSARGLCQGTR